MNDTLNRLDEQINVLLDQIPLMEGEERIAALKELDTLHSLRIEELKVEEESANNKATVAETKKARIGKFVTDTASIIVPAGLSAIFMLLGFKFEETGSIRSSTFKWLQKFIKVSR